MSRAIPPRCKKARLGQHELRDPFVLDRIAEFIHVRPGDRVIEIGPGRGALTRVLARPLGEAGRLTALEIDARLAAELREEFAAEPNVSILEADALKFDFSSLRGEGAIRLVGNLPYYAATAILLRLIESREDIEDIVVMVQKEVAERIAARPGSKAYGTLSLAVQLWCGVEPGFDVDPSTFSPRPKVFSTVLRLLPQAQPRASIGDPAFFERVVRAAFAQRRKTLLNNLKSHFSGEEEGVNEALAGCDIDPVRRAETLSLEEFANLSEKLGRILKD
ncbi:MAG: 16S rRNA (adenine(1518)-N(6)/adenine(1519)-N(6))-dimethyltransferase RsmA [Nitrospinota bacterium]|jgi:16S rRNA (adenine1518-N6/adenine1519-N6)-dimethyltransferase|nr:16S rRNA (adenine(1518)-N(6)/adenine(1519)-N(6))-dimethyltransferase RsmA [Nitrospinota bacterium]HJM42132.1 16S rRNA (adenine(1518)-N(6)/adenine(1519)-N(6))-dimethyltransferase RsmA [Nitrospinota bacterium]